MRPAVVIVIKIRPERTDQLMAVVVVPQINIFIFDRPLQTLGKDIVETPAFAGHADGDLTLFQFLRKIAASVLLALVRMKNLRRRYPQRFIKGVKAKQRLKAVRDRPAHYISAELIHGRNKVHETTQHADIRYVRTPHLIGIET